MKGVLGCSKGARKKLEIGRWVRNGDKGSRNGKERVTQATSL